MRQGTVLARDAAGFSQVSVEAGELTLAGTDFIEAAKRVNDSAVAKILADVEALGFGRTHASSARPFFCATEGNCAERDCDEKREPTSHVRPTSARLRSTALVLEAKHREEVRPGTSSKSSTP